MRIITISRQFGSGGRELGKRLADELGWDYYDREIIEKMSMQKGMDPDYVEKMVSSHAWNTIPLTYRNSFAGLLSTPSTGTELLVLQREIIEDIAKAGHDCIIVGRDADIILRDYKPFRIFVCAETEARLARCMRFENKKKKDRLSEREILRSIRRMDKNRSHVREMLTGKAWGDGSCFDLTINSTSWDIKTLAPAAAAFATRWFEDNEQQK